MEFVRPKRLIPGQSTIGLIAPSGVVDKHSLEQGMKIINDWGFSEKLGKHIRATSGDYSAGTESQRAQDFLEMVGSSEVSAVGSIIGGFAAIGLMKALDPKKLDPLKEKPKIFFGYSDFSLILNALFSRGIISLHAPNVCGLFLRSLNSQKSLKLSLLGDLPSEIGPLANWTPVKPGFTRGRLLVSNLEGLVDLLGTPFDPLANVDEGVILAIEEVGENKSTIARWAERLAIDDNAKKIQGIILGRFTEVGEIDYPIWGKKFSVERIFRKVFHQKGLPIASLPEFGHTEEPRGIFKKIQSRGREKTDFLTLPSGVRVLFKVKADSCRLVFLERAII